MTQPISRLTFIEKISFGSNPKALYRCECGTVKAIQIGNVKNGHTTSCGCLRRAMVKHGLRTTHGNARRGAQSRLYKIWKGIQTRCTNEKHNRYRHYGGKGIAVCEAWRSFGAFKTWAIAAGYNESLSIDRINTNGNYEPDNCRWATAKEQSRNRSTNKMVTHNGETKCIAAWADELGIDYEVLRAHLSNGGEITVEELA